MRDIKGQNYTPGWLVLHLLTALAVVCCALLATPARAEDSQAEAILDLSRDYTAEWEYGRLDFSADIPELNELTPDERELLEGDWLPLTLELISYWPGYYLELPERITTNNLCQACDSWLEHVVIEDDSYRGSFRSAFEERYLCPLTCRYPRLNSEEFSKGNFYMLILTPQEQSHILSMLEEERGTADDQLETYIRSTSIYYRYYGESGVLAHGILWAPMFDMWGEQPHIIPDEDERED